MTGPAARVLVVEDDRTTADLLALYLRHAGHRAEVVHAGDAAVARLAAGDLDLLLLDVMLPGLDGHAVCQAAREAGAAVIFVSARTQEDDRVAGLELGADDYVPKPFSPRELMARVAAVLRRRPPGDHQVLARGPLRIDLAARAVTLDGRDVTLTPSEFAILVSLARNPGHVRSRQALLDAAGGEPGRALDRTVDVHIRNLRRKIERDPSAPSLIVTAPGVGYRFAPPDDAR